MIDPPGKIVCVGLNYHDHVVEQRLEEPSRPILFAKWPNALIGDGNPIHLPPISTQVDFEAELGVVIGRRGGHIRTEDAAYFIKGYVAANDVSARDLQFADGQWTRGKSLDSFLPVSELMAIQAVPDPQGLAIRAVLNGETMQAASTADQIFTVAELIAFISESITLEPDDLILTGTPAGSGAFRDPPVWLKAGDTITIEIDGVGRVSNPVVASSARDQALDLR